MHATPSIPGILRGMYNSVHRLVLLSQIPSTNVRPAFHLRLPWQRACPRCHQICHTYPCHFTSSRLKSIVKEFRDNLFFMTRHSSLARPTTVRRLSIHVLIKSCLHTVHAIYSARHGFQVVVCTVFKQHLDRVTYVLYKKHAVAGATCA